MTQFDGQLQFLFNWQWSTIYFVSIGNSGFGSQHTITSLQFQSYIYIFSYLMMVSITKSKNKKPLNFFFPINNPSWLRLCQCQTINFSCVNVLNIHYKRSIKGKCCKTLWATIEFPTCWYMVSPHLMRSVALETSMMWSLQINIFLKPLQIQYAKGSLLHDHVPLP